MLSKTPNRLLALTLILVTSQLYAQEPGSSPENNAAPQLPDQNNTRGRRTDRQPYTRPQPGMYPSLAPAPVAPSPAPPAQPAAPAPVPQAAPAYAAPPSTPAHRATVSYTDGQLFVVASNSSLNQILRDISRAADIKITGGVTEERVFGNYGPATPLEVLSSLLDGTSGNMFLLQGTDGHPSELVLTTRTGGPTPPNPNAAGFESGNDDQATAPSLPQQPALLPGGAPPPASADDDTPAAVPPPAATTGSGDQSGTAPRTPQQIFDELMKLRQNQPH